MTTARKRSVREPYLEVGRVERVESSAAPSSVRTPKLVTAGARGEATLFHVRFATGAREARRAKSCLVAPEVGDTVLCAAHAEGCHIVAVLDGAFGGATRLSAEGDLHVEPQGKLSLSSREGVSLTTDRALTIGAADVAVNAERGTATIDELGFFGRLVRADAEKIVVVARELDHVVGRLTQRLKRAFRFVEDMDQTRAGSIDLRADDLASVRGENTVVSARALAKVDGEQIHIG